MLIATNKDNEQVVVLCNDLDTDFDWSVIDYVIEMTYNNKLFIRHQSSIT
jgi:hypothetical protein